MGETEILFMTVNDLYHPILICHSRTVIEWDFLKQSRHTNLVYCPVLSHPVPFICSRTAIPLMLGVFRCLTSKQSIHPKGSFFLAIWTQQPQHCHSQAQRRWTHPGKKQPGESSCCLGWRIGIISAVYPRKTHHKRSCFLAWIMGSIL